MSYAIVRVAKLKGKAVAAAGRHNSRGRETPNADKERENLNRLLIGDDRPLEVVVQEKIHQHHPDGKPRRDSVEAIEILLAASPEWFSNARGKIDQSKLDAWVRRNVEWLQAKYGDKIVKAYLHLDEKSPHIQAVMVPIDPKDKLNAKHFLDGGKVFDKKNGEWIEKRGQKLRELQDDYAAAMKPLGLERGIRGSIATHERIQRFYGAIERQVELRVEPERLPDPPMMLATKAQREAYKERVIEAVLQQLHAPFQTMREQALLTREEAGKREEAEARLERAELRMVELEQKIEARDQQEQDYVRRIGELGRNLIDQRERMRDLSLPRVMSGFGYAGEQHGATTVYRDARGAIAMTIAGNEVRHGDAVMTMNSIQMVRYIHRTQSREELSERDALGWIADRFGDERAVASYAVSHEAQAISELRVRDVERHRQAEREQELVREPQRDHVPERDTVTRSGHQQQMPIERQQPAGRDEHERAARSR